jgi:hypothetical protein
MVKIEFKTSNAAFSDGNDGYEIARILRELADEAESGMLVPHGIRDINGNRIGECDYD